MVLKRIDIACFVANWTDKAANLREIAQRLNIGLDSLVFADDNPVERAIVRRELPMVEVPELPEDPTGYGACLADAGYFEALRITAEDLARAEQYQQNLARESLMASATDMEGFLRSLEMRAVWNRFDRVGLARIVQLINKTNQFNLTTRRVNEEQIPALIDDPAALQFANPPARQVRRQRHHRHRVRRARSRQRRHSHRHLADELPRARPRDGGGDAQPGRRRGAAAWCERA